MKFSIGEVVVGQNFIFNTFRNGMEATVLTDLHWSKWHNDSDNSTGSGYGYRVRWSDGSISFQYPNQLRKKRPPEELSSWDKIEEICGWSPVKIIRVPSIDKLLELSQACSSGC